MFHLPQPHLLSGPRIDDCRCSAEKRLLLSARRVVTMLMTLPVFKDTFYLNSDDYSLFQLFVLRAVEQLTTTLEFVSVLRQLGFKWGIVNG